MIRIEAIQLQRIAVEALRQLNVADTVRAMEVRELTDGMWLVLFEDRRPATRFPVFEIHIQQDWSAEQAGRELRFELRKKLWVCPLCQRRALIRRLVDQEAFRVECEYCGRFEIEAALLEHLRQSLEQRGEATARQLARLADRVRQANKITFLSTDNWEHLVI